MYISFNVAVAAFKTGFTEDSGAEMLNLAFAECSV